MKIDWFYKCSIQSTKIILVHPKCDMIMVPSNCCNIRLCSIANCQISLLISISKVIALPTMAKTMAVTLSCS